MAEMDPLINLREAIAAGKLPIPTTSADASHAEDIEQDLAKATYLQFNHVDGQHRSIPLNTPTRFTSGEQPISLRSVYFAFQKKDAAVAEYINSTQRVNELLAATGGAGGEVKNLVFAERLDLVTWLEGGSDDSENIKPLASEVKAAATNADIAAGATDGAAALPAGANKPGDMETDAKLWIIYNSERRMGDRNTVLRGTKPTDFSIVKNHARSFIRRQRAPQTAANPLVSNPSLVSNLNKKSSGRRLEPIILLSPSASSLIRMSNVKPFLSDGTYLPADSATASSTGANILHLTRILPSIDPTRPTRFILVDTPDQFKPDYWSRVVAVFTTGQTWQFKSYKWTQPAELFSHALGIYIGWKGEGAPDSVRGWGRGVVSQELDKFNPHAGAGGRWRDREVVEQIWRAIEFSMRSKGWTKEGPPGLRA